MHQTVKPFVTIIIASHRQNYIQKCLEGFRGDVLGDVAAEIIVVADYPAEGFLTLFPEVLWVFHAERSISAKRNYGIKHAQGALIGFIDDDCLPKDAWVTRAVQYMQQNPSHAGVVGRTIVEQVNGVSYPLKEFKRLENPGFRTNNIFYRKEVLDLVGGFDPRFTFQREDVDLAFSILRRGLCIGYCPDIQVLHLHRRGENWDLLKNCYNRRFDPLLYKKHPDLYRQWIKTPVTPSIAALSALHGLLIAGLCAGCAIGCFIVCDLAFAMALSVRRNMQCGFHGVRIAHDWLSYCISPFVLFGALVQGSLKFKKFLIF